MKGEGGVLCAVVPEVTQGEPPFSVCFADGRWRLVPLVLCKTSTIAIHLTPPHVREQPWIQVLPGICTGTFNINNDTVERDGAERCSASLVANAVA